MIGFLSPEAIFYECESWGHSSKAIEIYEKLYGEHYYGNTEDYLLSLGYIVIRARDAYRKSWHNGKFVVLTDKQLEWIEDHSELFTNTTKKDLSDMLLENEHRKKRFG